MPHAAHAPLQDMLANGMSGVALIGADICGFQDSASEELCARWAAAGAWQPLARDHHAQGFQELYLCAPNTLGHCFTLFVLHAMPMAKRGHRAQGFQELYLWGPLCSGQCFIRLVSVYPGNAHGGRAVMSIPTRSAALQ